MGIGWVLGLELHLLLLREGGSLGSVSAVWATECAAAAGEWDAARSLGNHVTAREIVRLWKGRQLERCVVGWCSRRC